jgi:hypothetical protein
VPSRLDRGDRVIGPSSRRRAHDYGIDSVSYKDLFNRIGDWAVEVVSEYACCSPAEFSQCRFRIGCRCGDYLDIGPIASDFSVRLSVVRFDADDTESKGNIS